MNKQQKLPPLEIGKPRFLSTRNGVTTVAPKEGSNFLKELIEELERE